MKYQDKNILISGGSSGIGYALAEQMLKKGANICLLARRKELLKQAQDSLNSSKVIENQKITTISADVSDYSDLEKSLKKIREPFDVLVNSAGIAYPGEFFDLSPDIFAKVMKINYLGTVYLSKLVLPGMIAQKSGYIVNIASLAALIGIYGYTAYAPSKYAVRGFSRCLRSEVKAHGIDVSVVFPPDTDTPQLEFEHSIIPDITRKINSGAGVMSAEKVAEVILRGMDRKRFSIYPGMEGKLLCALAPIVGRFFYHQAVREHRKKLV